MSFEIFEKLICLLHNWSKNIYDKKVSPEGYNLTWSHAESNRALDYTGSFERAVTQFACHAVNGQLSRH